MSQAYVNNEYRCKLLRVVDGDTLHLEVDLGLRVQTQVHARIIGLYAPESRGPEAELGKVATAAAMEIMQRFKNSGECLLVRFSKGKSFDRWLAKVFIRHIDGTEVDFAEEMIKTGQAHG